MAETIDVTPTNSGDGGSNSNTNITNNNERDVSGSITITYVMYGMHAFSAVMGLISPMLIVTSTQDHVVPPENSDLLAAQVSGPVERLVCERSYHVVTMDYDKDLVIAASVDFAAKVTAGA